MPRQALLSRMLHHLFPHCLYFKQLLTQSECAVRITQTLHPALKFSLIQCLQYVLKLQFGFVVQQIFPTNS